MKTATDLRFHTRGGLPFIVPAGAEVEPNPHRAGFYWIKPDALAQGSIERHDATYYGLDVSADEVTP